MSIKTVQEAVKAAGGTPAEVYTLAGIAYIHTGGDPGWTSGDGKGAFGVSQKWYPGTPDDLTGQAKQALSIFRRQGFTGMTDDLPLAALRWWYPSSEATLAVKNRIKIRADKYRQLAKSSLSLAGMSGWMWVLIAGVAVWYFFGSKK